MDSTALDFNDSPEEAAFRAEVRSWLEANARRRSTPGETAFDGARDDAERTDIAKAWQQRIYDAGWACMWWPKAYGGRDATPIQRVIWGQEVADFVTPDGFFIIGQGMIAPTLMAYASDEQKARYLPRLASGEEIWCQLFSEPVAGSDLAGIATKAERDGDEWVINGQKIWTSGAHYSDFGAIVTRSDPSVAKHKGLTYFFLDMRAPGVEIRPIKQVNGDSGFNEVFFNDVRIPDAQRLGGVGEGWKVALVTLMNERLSIGSGNMMAGLEPLMQLASETLVNGEPALADPAVRARMADWYVDASGLKFTNYRMISALSRGAAPGPEASIGKLIIARNNNETADFALDLMDMGGILDDPALVPQQNRFQNQFLRALANRIEGGSDEILRNVVSERVLGMPPDIRPDKDVPYADIPKGTAH